MIHHKTTLSAMASYGAGVSGMTIGTWLADAWLQLASLLFMGATFAVSVYFRVRRDGRELERHNAHMKQHEQRMDTIEEKTSA